MAVKNFIKENFVLAVGLALPVLLIVLFFAASIIPKLLATPPQYEMLFTTVQYAPGNGILYHINFTVKDGSLKIATTKPGNGQIYQWQKLYKYNAKTNAVQEIPYDMPKSAKAEAVLKETANLVITPAATAPDGYTFEVGSYSSGGLATEMFSGGYRSVYRVKKGAVSFKIPSHDRYADLQFIGWIVKQR